jgi:monovalent cation/hydrogen antiporter
LTLRPLMLRLRLEDDGTVEREVHLARVETLRAAVAAAEEAQREEAAPLVRDRYVLQLQRAEAARAGSPAAPPDVPERNADAEVVRAVNEAQRHRLVALRSEGTIGDAAFQRVEEELDWMELGWAQVVGDHDGQRRGN